MAWTTAHVVWHCPAFRWLQGGKFLCAPFRHWQPDFGYSMLICGAFKVGKTSERRTPTAPHCPPLSPLCPPTHKFSMYANCWRQRNDQKQNFLTLNELRNGGVGGCRGGHFRQKNQIWDCLIGCQWKVESGNAWPSRMINMQKYICFDTLLIGPRVGRKVSLRMICKLHKLTMMKRQKLFWNYIFISFNLTRLLKRIILHQL